MPAEPASEPETAPEAEAAPAPGRHRRTSQRPESPRRGRSGLRTVSLVCLLLCIPAAAAAVLLALRHHSSDATATAREQALTAAKQAAHDVLSYDYRTLDADVARAKKETTGLFAQQYSQSAGQLLSQAKQVRAIVQASVGLPGVVSATDDQVVVLVFVDQASVKQTAGQKTPTTRIDQSRVRLTMTKVGDRWLVSALSAL